MPLPNGILDIATVVRRTTEKSISDFPLSYFRDLPEMDAGGDIGACVGMYHVAGRLAGEKVKLIDNCIIAGVDTAAQKARLSQATPEAPVMCTITVPPADAEHGFPFIVANDVAVS